MSKKILLFILFTSLSLIAVSLYLISTIDPGAKAKPTAEITNIISEKINITEEFKLHDFNGKAFTIDDLQNKLSLIYFGFTHCPDLCPYTLQKFKEASSLLSSEELNLVQFIFVSIDPSRDNNESLKVFVIENGGENVVGVTGDSIELDKLASPLKAYYAKLDENNKDNYYVDHTSFLYMLSPKAELISQFSQNATATEIADQVKEKIATYKK